MEGGIRRRGRCDRDDGGDGGRDKEKSDRDDGGGDEGEE